MKNVKFYAAILGGLGIFLLGAAYVMAWAIFGLFVFHTLGFSQINGAMLTLCAMGASIGIMVIGFATCYRAERFVG